MIPPFKAIWLKADYSIERFYVYPICEQGMQCLEISFSSSVEWGAVPDIFRRKTRLLISSYMESCAVIMHERKYDSSVSL